MAQALTHAEEDSRFCRVKAGFSSTGGVLGAAINISPRMSILEPSLLFPCPAWLGQPGSAGAELRVSCAQKCPTGVAMRWVMDLERWESVLLQGPGHSFLPSLGQSVTTASSAACDANEGEQLLILSSPQNAAKHRNGQRKSQQLPHLPGQSKACGFCSALSPLVLPGLHPAEDTNKSIMPILQDTDRNCQVF